MPTNPDSHRNLQPSFKPGTSGNRSGRPPNAGRTIREKINEYAADGLTERQLRRIHTDETAPAVDRAAARECLAMIGRTCMADFEPFLLGHKTLEQLAAEGIDTSVVESVTIAPGQFGTRRSIKLRHDAREATKMVIEQTDGTPTKTIKHHHDGSIAFSTDEERTAAILRRIQELRAHRPGSSN
jgi:hypothetical protein